jgi:23S rRNA (cytosine1962-C5)-methyltransferase
VTTPMLSSTLPKLILFEDDHLLVVNKPAGLNTHAPSPFGGEGLYDWLRDREPRWNRLALIHRLDKETSGLLVFTKTPLANRSLTEQFTRHAIRKKYQLVTDRQTAQKEFTVVSALVRVGGKYVSRPLHAGAACAKTRFRVVEQSIDCTLLEAEPFTGRTHQIRVHAAAEGIPIRGDTLYGGTPASRVFLHAEELKLKHPVAGEEMIFHATPAFEEEARLSLRESLVELDQTNAFRLIHGASDYCPGWYLDRLGEFLLSQSERALTADQRDRLTKLLTATGPGKTEQAMRNRQYASGFTGVYHKLLTRRVRQASPTGACPQLAGGEPAPERFAVLENGLKFELSFNEGYSVGLFLDQRDNRRRFLVNYVGADFPLFESGAAGREVLNTFAYTCGFSVCAATAGARTTSLDLSKKYLEWAQRNFRLNGLDPAAHNFIYGDVFDWLRRLAKKQRTFDAIILDPPTFSQSKEHVAFRAEKDYGKLAAAALPLLKPNGILFASTNAATLKSEDFLRLIEQAVGLARRRILQRHYVPQPPDFPITRAEPAYLKTVWLRIA